MPAVGPGSAQRSTQKKQTFSGSRVSEFCTPAPPGQQRWIELKIPRADTKVVLFTADGHEDRIGTFTGVSFTTDNVEKTHADYVARGVEFSEGPTKQPWGTYAILKDVDGNQFVLSQK